MYYILSNDATVAGLVGPTTSPRIYPLGIPSGKGVPAVVYQIISSQELTTCDHQIEPRTERVQVTCWDDDPDGAVTLAEAVRAALQGASGSYGTIRIQYCALDDEGDDLHVDEHSERLTRYGKRQDWEVAYETS